MNIEGLALCFLYLVIFNKKIFQNKIEILITTIVYSLLIFISLKTSFSITFFIVLLMPAIYKIIFKTDYKQSYSAYLLSFDVIVFFQFTINFIIYIPTGKNIENNSVIIILELFLLLFATYLYNQRIFLQNMFRLISQNIAFQILFILSNISIALSLLIYNILKNTFLQYFYFLFLTFFSLTTISLLYFKNELMLEANILKLHHEKKINKDIEGFVGDIIRKQHESNNHIQAILMLVSSTDDINLLRTKLSENYNVSNIKGLEIYNVFNKLERIMTESMILTKILKAKSLGIDFIYNIQKITIDENIEDYTLCEIVSCLLDNAFESGSLKISLNIYKSNEKSVIEVKNEHERLGAFFIQSMFKKGFSTKTNKNKDQIKGYGLYNLSKILANHEVELSIYNELLENTNYVVFKLIFLS